MLDELCAGLNDIYIINSDGADLTKLTPDDSHKERPDWSPNGSKIAFISDRNGERELFIMDTEGSNITKLETPVGYSFAWSHLGNKIAFASSKDGNPEIYIIDINSLDIVNISNDEAIEFSPSW